MAGAKLVATKYPGIYKRGARYVYEWTNAAGKRQRATAETLADARTRKADREREAREGAPAAPEVGKATFGRYARELYGADLTRADGQEPARGRYAGRRGAVRERTRNDYRRHIELYWLPSLSARAVASITAADLRRVIDRLAARDGGDEGDYIADATMRRLFAPLSALLATAAEEGLIPTNVSRDVTLPSGRDRLRKFAAGIDDEDDEGPAKTLTREEFDTFMTIVDQRHRTFFHLLAETGLRFSEATALRWRDLTLDGGAAHLRVRRACVRGVFGPPKTEHSRRSVPLSPTLVYALRARHAQTEWPHPDDLAFPSTTGTPIADENLRKRTLMPAAQEAGVPWAGFHAFRHFCASTLIDQGRNIVQVSKWLGHHSPAFTLTVYAHLLDDGVGAPLDLFGGAQGVGPGSDSGVRERAGQSDPGLVIPDGMGDLTDEHARHEQGAPRF
ncbi:site-specific integrase [Paraconexibacter antarcticus]|uniref:Site-specific integrase n=1 Tax=Paraconexibacter antarcticus TaxID=2949664 RepID=A0ABY5DND8_9ACTN|nr:site-specific integrase [Paraconexibacter antarcticus]UTI62250.1 site-specific integrase [Paraconexibacter antarcticus]